MLHYTRTYPAGHINASTSARLDVTTWAAWAVSGDLGSNATDLPVAFSMQTSFQPSPTLRIFSGGTLSLSTRCLMTFDLQQGCSKQPNSWNMAGAGVTTPVAF